MFCFKVWQDESPLNIADLLTTNKSVHGTETRHTANTGQYNFVCSKFQHITDGERSLSFSSVKLSNGLPYEIKRRNSLLSFKNALKTYFINSYIDIDNFEILLQMFLS